MNIHEYQAKRIFREYGIPVLAGGMAPSPDEAVSVAEQMGTDRWIVKAQIHAGGRSVGHFEGAEQNNGGVCKADSVEAVRRIAGDMLNNVLVTPQTGPAGREVKRVYIEQYYGNIQRELYLAMLIERRSGQLTLLASAAGGEDIESVGTDSILKLPVSIDEGIAPQALKKLATEFRMDAEQAVELARIVDAMYKLFTERDASLIEINPLAINAAGKLVALDAVVTLDDNAMFRHPESERLRDQNELLVGELEAAQHGLNYVKLKGNVGCLASGAGLSLATLDAIKLIGGEPANFMDVPPVAQVERVSQALKLVLSDPDVNSVLVNVFGGGIMRCDTIADAIVLVNREASIKVPMVVRLAGTNANFALRRLHDMGPKIVFSENLADAAEKAVAAAKHKVEAVRRSWWERVMGAEQN